MKIPTEIKRLSIVSAGAAFIFLGFSEASQAFGVGFPSKSTNYNYAVPPSFAARTQSTVRSSSPYSAYEGLHSVITLLELFGKNWSGEQGNGGYLDPTIFNNLLDNNRLSNSRLNVNPVLGEHQGSIGQFDKVWDSSGNGTFMDVLAKDSWRATQPKFSSTLDSRNSFRNRREFPIVNVNQASVPVPEPTTIIGSLVTLGFGLALKRKLKRV
jgi:hypothetical protein